jgi:hypothetical protein
MATECNVLTQRLNIRQIRIAPTLETEVREVLNLNLGQYTATGIFVVFFSASKEILGSYLEDPSNASFLILSIS